MGKTAFLLVNLGTPKSTGVSDVREYLDQFLSDPRVLDMNSVGRWLLLKTVILPRRPKKTAEAYKKIWTKRGSPLLVEGEDLVEKLKPRLGDSYWVRLAMRYQHPSIEEVWRSAAEEGIDRCVVFPLFPHYSSAAWGSAVEEVFRVLGREWNVPSIQVVPPYYDHPAFIKSLASVAEKTLREFSPDYILMSYHGLPERHCTKSDTTGERCFSSRNCCDEIVEANRYCYRAQCFATSRALAKSLKTTVEWGVSFQSRLGRDPWILPYTDSRIEELAKEGKRRIAVFSPSFTADCLETLEEIAIRAKEDFINAGGEDLALIPSLNSQDIWADSICQISNDSFPPLHLGANTEAGVEHCNEITKEARSS